MGQYLAERGLTVSGICLAGHGTIPESLARVTWQDWVASVEDGLAELKKDRVRKIFFVGLSVGALLGLYVAPKHPEIDGLVALAPILGMKDWRFYLTSIARYLVPYSYLGRESSDLASPEVYEKIWCYDKVSTHASWELVKLRNRVRKMIPEISVPILLIQSKQDQTVPIKYAYKLYERIASVDKQLVFLERSGHCLTVDVECEQVWELSYRWIVERSGMEGGM